MKTKRIRTIYGLAILAVVIILFGACPVRAVVWTEGYHQINPGDVYGEVDIYNDVTLDIFGGDIFRLAAFDNTYTNWYGGEMDDLWARDNSIVNIFGGDLFVLAAAENSLVNLCAYNVVIETTGGFYDYGYVTGKFYSNDDFFYFNMAKDAYLHINIIPEPATIILLGIGSFLVIRKK